MKTVKELVNIYATTPTGQNLIKLENKLNIESRLFRHSNKQNLKKNVLMQQLKHDNFEYNKKNLENFSQTISNKGKEKTSLQREKNSKTPTSPEDMRNPLQMFYCQLYTSETLFW